VYWGAASAVGSFVFSIQTSAGVSAGVFLCLCWGGLSFWDGGLVEDDDFGVVSVVSVVVEAVADDEFVGDLEADIVAFDIDGAGGLFVEHDAEAEGGGFLFEDDGFDEGEGLSRVEDVVEDDDVFACEVVGEVGFEVGAF